MPPCGAVLQYTKGLNILKFRLNIRKLFPSFGTVLKVVENIIRRLSMDTGRLLKAGALHKLAR